MSYVNPKTNWQDLNVPTSSDFNRIEGNIGFVKSKTDQNGLAINNVAGDVTAIGNAVAIISNEINSLENRVGVLEQDEGDWATTQYVDNAVSGISKEATRNDASLPLRIEVRTSDPVTPAVGRLWIVTT